MMKDQIVELSELKENELYTIEELAPLLRISTRTLRRYCVDNVLEHATKMGGKQWVIPGCDVMELCPHLKKDSHGCNY